MSHHKRLQKLETSLTPKQAVLLWLKEVLQFESPEYFKKLLTSPRSEHPRHRIPDNVAQALPKPRPIRTLTGNLREPQRKAVQARTELEARKQADFLICLVFELNAAVDTKAEPDVFALLWVQLQSMAERFDDHGTANATAWEVWRSMLVDRLATLWLLRSIITAIREQYFDGHEVLFPDKARTLADWTKLAEVMADVYNNAGEGLPGWETIDLVKLQATVEGRLSAAVERVVAAAKADVLRRFGDWTAASRLMEPHLRRAFGNGD